MFFLTSDFKGLKNWNAKLGVPHWPIAKSDFFPRKTFRWPSLIFLPFGASCHFFQLSVNFFFLLLAASKSSSSNIHKKTVRMIKIICHSRYATLHWLAGLGYSLSYAVMLLWLPQSYVLCLDRTEITWKRFPGIGRMRKNLNRWGIWGS